MKKEKGITLLVLVVIIIVMLILVGVTFASISSNNGIFQTIKQLTEKEKEESKDAQNDIKYLEKDLQKNY